MILDSTLKDGEMKIYKDLGNGWVEDLESINIQNNLLSSYGSIDVDELNKTIDRLGKMPDYDILMKENNKLVYKWEELIKRLMNKFNETQETFYLDIIQMMEEIDKKSKGKGDK